ncbi:hypothetical protein [Nostoc sp. WHI]|uniref:hypothetical protein n=1 Tax=Nostoc sp. WHI TaxID=2650611 RepID=UPI0018C6A1FF|nr:hypothetical protein [Nostoc sp. WHI]MBG1267515.1 hypothetical protein [Nostoc sp. WHI]MBG1267522.1 hypothetical protein [Nostoc sp. WHI]
MESKERNYNGQIQIDDLINDAVENALARRNQALDSEDVLSNEEMKNVVGGISIIKPPLISGIIVCPTTIGLVAYPDESLLS